MRRALCILILVSALLVMGISVNGVADNRYNTIIPQPAATQISGGPSTSSGACAASLPALERGIDRPGQDYQTIPLTGVQPCACAELCQNDDTCQAFTYVPPGMQGPSAQCWLKNGVPSPVANKDVISGVKSGSGSVENPGFNIFHCPSPMPVPVIRVGSGESTEVGVLYPITLVNIAEFPDDIFFCDVSGCRMTAEIIYETGEVVPFSRPIATREDLTAGLVARGSDSAPPRGVQVRISVPSCNLSTISNVATPSSDEWISYPINSTPTDDHTTFTTSACELEENTDRPGHDIRSIPLSSNVPCECSRLCQNESSCVAFTYVSPGVQGPTAICYLKNAASSPVPNANCVSGLAGPG